jgi:hypothetical protein
MRDASLIFLANAGLMALLTTACTAPGAREARKEGPVFHVADFGAVGDGTTDDGPAIREAIGRAVEADGPATVRFEPKTYRVAPRYDRWCAFAIEDARGVTLDGQGATLVLHPDNRALLIYRSQGIAVRNFTVDFDPLPFTQGDVTAVDRERKEIHVRIHDGFPLPDGGIGRHGAFIEAGRRRYTHKWSYLGAVRRLSEPERLYAVAGNAEQGHADAILQTEVASASSSPSPSARTRASRTPASSSARGGRTRGCSTPTRRARSRSASAAAARWRTSRFTPRPPCVSA